MLFDDFAHTSHNFWTSYFRSIAVAQTAAVQTLFPTMLIASEFDGFYISELVGAVRAFDGLRARKNRGGSIYAHLDQFGVDDPNALFILGARGVSFKYLCLSHHGDLDALQARFPFLDLYQTKLIAPDSRGSLFKFQPNFRSCYIENCVLVNRKENIFRCKNILSAMIVASRITKKELTSLYQSIVNQRESDGRLHVRGVHSVDSKRAESVLVAATLQSSYLSPGVKEVAIGDILRDHPQILRNALKSKRIVFAPYLRWIDDDGAVGDKAIVPDFMAHREDGFFDIYELKTAALERHKITKGKRKRRRFIDYVEEGMAQLANYREYFNYGANAQYAADRYGIRVSEPKLTLIAGNMDNTDTDEVAEACRRYRDLALIDYDTLVQLFIGAAEATITMGTPAA